MEEVAECRGCGMEMVGKPFYRGGLAYHPKTKEQCKTNFYGGFVCSKECDYNSSLRLERTMPGHAHDQSALCGPSREAFKRNWG